MTYCLFFFFGGFCRIAFLCITQAYELNCPSYAQWKIRGFSHCNSSMIYTCLLDTNRHTYSEHCGLSLNVLEKGYKFVITGMLDRQSCGEKRFQPFRFLSNISDNCLMLKYQCNGEGQVVYRNGTTSDDRSCRCNYMDNFVPVTKYNGRCYCIPSEEDCSCHRQICPVGQYITPDYQCVHLSNWTGNFNCTEIQQVKKPTIVATSHANFITDLEKDSDFSSLMMIYVLASSMILFPICSGTVSFCQKYRNLRELVRDQSTDPQTQSKRLESEKIPKDMEIFVLTVIADISKKPGEIKPDDVHSITEC